VTPTLTIDLQERDTLRGQLSRRLLILVENPSALARAEGITVVRLDERLADDLRLMEEIGWAEDGQAAVELAMPPEKLAETLKRLRRDARRARFSMRHKRESKESVGERCWRFRHAVIVCEELLTRLDLAGHKRKTIEARGGAA
jgi:hypothetical protein